MLPSAQLLEAAAKLLAQCNKASGSKPSIDELVGDALQRQFQAFGTDRTAFLNKLAREWDPNRDVREMAP